MAFYVHYYVPTFFMAYLNALYNFKIEYIYEFYSNYYQYSIIFIFNNRHELCSISNTYRPMDRTNAGVYRIIAFKGYNKDQYNIHGLCSICRINWWDYGDCLCLFIPYHLFFGSNFI